MGLPGHIFLSLFVLQFVFHPMSRLDIPEFIFLISCVLCFFIKHEILNPNDSNRAIGPHWTVINLWGQFNKFLMPVFVLLQSLECFMWLQPGKKTWICIEFTPYQPMINGCTNLSSLLIRSCLQWTTPWCLFILHRKWDIQLYQKLLISKIPVDFLTTSLVPRERIPPQKF